MPSALRGALLCISFPLLLAACATTPPGGEKTNGAPTTTTAIRPYHEAVDLGGRLSIQYQQNGSDQAMHGSFNWVQRADHTTVTLLSPLGQILAIIDTAPGSATLRQANQPTRTAPDVDTLTATTLGWPLPVAGLRDWLQGFALKPGGSRFVAMPGSDATTRVTTQDGWQLHYVSWQHDGEGMPYPRRLDLRRSTAQAGEVEIRVIVDSRQVR